VSLQVSSGASPWRASLAARDWRGVLDATRARLAVSPQDTEAGFWCGVAHQELGELRPAAALFDALLRLRPDDPACHAQAARARLRLGEHDRALTHAHRALHATDADSATLKTVGVVLSHLHRHAEALAVYRRVVERAPAYAEGWFDCAVSAKFTGDFDAAEAAYERCISLDGRHWRAHASLSQLRRWTPTHNHLTRLRALLPEAQGSDRVALQMALFKESEDLGDFVAAFACLDAAKAAHRARLQYSPDEDGPLFDAWRQAPMPLGPGCDDASAIFVVGMPRSGTTLVDRILSAHPEVASIGESPWIGHLLRRVTGVASEGWLDPRIAERSSAIDAAALGREYLRLARPAGTHRFVDKTPHNFFHVGVIARALPQAKIVLLLRDPIDTCLANFRQLFALTHPHFRYSWNLIDIAHYVRQFERLVAHWQAELPGRLHVVRYESLVDEPETQIRALLAACGLDWHPDCLQFERQQAPVSTASAVQVREPIHRAGIERRRHYEPMLGELLAWWAANESLPP